LNGEFFYPVASLVDHGGLSPDNLEEQLLKLDEVVGSDTIWIDAETHLRSNGDEIFDLEKVKQFLEVAKSRVIE
jgi:hypothetical protein